MIKILTELSVVPDGESIIEINSGETFKVSSKCIIGDKEIICDEGQKFLSNEGNKIYCFKGITEVIWLISGDNLIGYLDEGYLK